MGTLQLPGDLYQRWTDFGVRVSANSNLENASRLLATQYTETHRFYHTLPHIRHCLTEFDGARHIATNPNEVEMALWFHDIVYDTKRKDNEEKSAQIAYNAAKKMGLSEAFARRVGDLIVVTKHSGIPTGIDAKVLIDVDLAILGSPRETFKKYEQEIRQEYSWVPNEDFKAGRMVILKQFLDRDSVYSTDFFRKKYENAAQANLKYSLHRLRKTPKRGTKSLPTSRKEPLLATSRDDPESGIGMFSHYNDPDFQEKPLPEAGIGMFDHWFEHDDKDKGPDAGIGLFSHWTRDY